MNIALFSLEGSLFVLRWFHLFFGIIWIGLLYYFNFVQGSFMAEADAAAKSTVTQKLLPRALWWFRWGAMGTFLTGWLIIMMRGHMGGIEIFQTSWGVQILIGGVMGTLMWYNVWFVIWPNQKIVIQNAVDVAAGKPANPALAAVAARALTASRTNTMLSVGLLFFMGAASHLSLATGPESQYLLLTLILGVFLGAIEYNALKGKVGPMATIKGVVHLGFVIALVLYAVVEYCL
jgi:uncharacterized membrane protein